MKTKNEIKKGEFGYLASRKKKETIITSLFFAVIIGIFVAGLIITGTKNNYATLVAVVLVLPAARFAVNLIAVAMHKNTPESLVKKINDEAPDLINCFDCVVGNSKKPIGLVGVTISDTHICALTEKKIDDVHFYEKSIRDFIKNDKLSANVTLYVDESLYLKRIKALNTEAAHEKAEWLKESFLNMCL